MTQSKEAVVLRSLVYIGTAITGLVVLSLVGAVCIGGVVHINPGLFSLHYTSDNASLIPALVNTVIILALALAISVPIGLGSAIYLVEYAHKGSVVVRVIRVMAQTLQSIPSIIYGLAGYMIFVVALRWQLSLLSGACTLALMILPTIMRSSEEALLAVPNDLREASLALGADKLRTLRMVVLVEAAPAIKSGILLAAGRVIGESAALIYTAGTMAQIPLSLMGGGRTLSVHLYSLWCEGLKVEQAYATSFVLVVLVLGFNLLARRSKGGSCGTNNKDSQ